jgi:2-(1,2-epoxy-1,2-dihydrophenyl)acetyl-CoA isomerase
MTVMHTDQPLRHVRAERHGAVGIIALDRPERFNALDVPMAAELLQVTSAFADDDTVRCIVLTGGERVFCSGADLKDIRQRAESGPVSLHGSDSRVAIPDYGSGFNEIVGTLHRSIIELKRAPKPVIAAVKGIAAAGGFGLAMACDLVFASESASFEWAYHKTGLTGAESTTFFLPRLVGLRGALGLMFLSPRLDAAAALNAGLINDVFPVDTFDASVLRIAERLAAGPTEAYGVAKHLMHEAVGAVGLGGHLDRELEQLVRITGGEDFAEGLAAFFAKREPVFHRPEPRANAA